MRVWMKSGKIVDLTNIDPAIFDIDVIAHHLSQIGRWCGGSPQFYSVAEHSVLVSQTLADKYAKAGLLHDAHECVIGDIIRPVQECIDTTDIKYLKRYINVAIGKRYYLSPALMECKEVAVSDNLWLQVEGALFFDSWPKHNFIEYKKYYKRIEFLSPKAAKQSFLERFEIVQRLHV